MSKDESEIGRGKNRPVQRRARRGSKKGTAGLAFTKERRQEFLNHFAASCNATAAARSVGVSPDCIYRWRRKDAQFRAGWDEALDQGCARLEAESLRAATDTFKVRPRKAAEARVGAMDAKTALAVLEAYRRSHGRDPGEVRARPYDIEAVRRRLEAKMKALGALDSEGRPVRWDDPPAGKPPPPGESTGGEQ